MHRFALVILLALGISSVLSQETKQDAGQFRFYLRDLVRVTVQGEPDMTVERQIDGAGEINVPLLGGVRISGLTITEAEQAIAARYVSEQIFIRPEVVITVVAYAPKEATLLGQVGKQGKILFPADSTSLSVVEALAEAGGLTRIAKGDAVRVTRRDAGGNEQNFIINVEKLIAGRGTAGETFYLQPGDIVFVPERVF